MKRIIRKRDKRRAKARTDIINRLRTQLVEIAIGKTPPEIVDVNVDFYSKCNSTEQEILMRIFKINEDKELSEILEYHSEVG